MTVTRPNQVWAMDITYIPMARRLRASRRRVRLGDPSCAVLTVVDTMEAAFCVETRRRPGGPQRA